ncbi:hypothetical protein HBH52_103800 [Parastagonospora nodorum]|nr:hypothetical protein HBH52_103800 [Parastagonospora nodorum]
MYSGTAGSSELAPDGTFLLVGRRLWAWQNVAEHVVDVQAAVLTLLPLARIAQTDLLEARVVDEVGAPHVQVPADDYLGVESGMPVLRLLGPAPQAEAWDPEELDEVLTQRPVPDNDQLGVWMCGDGGSELGFRLCDERVAPFDARPVRVGVQQMLVGCLNVLLTCPRERVLQLDMVRAEAIVVEGENGRYEDRPAFALPQHKGVLGRQDTILPGNLDTLQVFGLSPGARLLLRGHRVQLVVPRHPPHSSEALLCLGKRNAAVLERLAHVSTENEIIVGMWQKLLQSLARRPGTTGGGVLRGAANEAGSTCTAASAVASSGSMVMSGEQ